MISRLDIDKRQQNNQHQRYGASQYRILSTCLPRGIFLVALLGLLTLLLLQTLRQSAPQPALAADLSCNQPIRILNLGDEIVVGEGSNQMVGYRQLLYHLLHGAGHDVLFVGGQQNSNSNFFPQAATRYQAESGLNMDEVADDLYRWLTQTEPDIVLLHVKNNPNSQDVEDFERLLAELLRFENDGETAVSLYVAHAINELPADPNITETNAAIAAALADQGRTDWQMVNLEAALDYQTDMGSSTLPNDLGYAKLARLWTSTLRNDEVLALPICLPLSLNQTTVPNVTSSGQPVTHYFSLTNHTSATLTNVHLTVQPETAACQFSTLSELAAGAQQRLYCQTEPDAEQLILASLEATHPVSGTVRNQGMGFVGLIQASLVVSKTSTTPVILSGTSADYTIHLLNNGELPLTLTLSDPDSSSTCVTHAPAQLAPGDQASYGCSSGPKTADFTTTLTVTGTYSTGDSTVQVVETSTLDIEVINPDLTLVSHGPAQQTVPFSETAVFTTTIQNSGDVPLVNLTLDYPAATVCNATINQLDAGQSETVSCRLPNVTQEFNNAVQITGEDPLGNLVSTSSSAAFVDLIPILTLQKTAVPEQLPEPGGDVTFTLQLSNPTNEPLTLTALNNVAYGNLLDANNSAVFNNSCASLAALPENETVTCQFQTAVNSPPGSITSQTIATAADDDGHNGLQDNDAATVTVTNLPPELEISLTATPQQIEAPGGEVTFELTIYNRSSADTVQLTSLVDSRLGNLLNGGICQPAAALTISAAYQCQYKTTISGQAEESIAVSLTVDGLDEEETAVSQSTTLTITLMPPKRHTLFLPLLAQQARSSDEPNDGCQTAYPVEAGQSYAFFPNDVNDWYTFDFDGGDLTITLDNFTPEIGQIILWRGQCGALELLGNNGNARPQKVIQQANLPAGTYFIWVIADGPKSETIPYQLIIQND